MEKDHLYLNDIYIKKCLSKFYSYTHICIYIFHRIYIRYIVCSMFKKNCCNIVIWFNTYICIYIYGSAYT